MATPAAVTPPRSKIDERLARETAREAARDAAREVETSTAATVPQSEEKPGRSKFQKRIDQLIAKNSASEERVRQLERRVQELEAEKWREHVSVFADQADAQRLLAEYRNQLRRYHDAFVAMKEARHYGNR